MRKFLYVLLALVALYLILAMIGPKEVTVNREIVIEKPAEKIRPLLSNYYFFNEKWNPWMLLDSNVQVTYRGDPGMPGHAYDWAGNDDVREGTQEFVGVSGDTVIQKIKFGKEGKSGEARVDMIASDENGSSKVKWQMKFDIGFLMRPVMLFGVMDKMMGEMFEKGLARLKTAAEDMEEAPEYVIEEQQWDEKTFIGSKRKTMSAQECGVFFGANFPKMFEDLGKNKVTSAMAPTAAFYNWDDKTMQTECATMMQVPAGTNVKGWEKYVIPPSKVLHIAYYGDYNKTQAAHGAMEKYIAEKGLNKNFVLEEYVTDPASEKDTTRWLTNIYYVLN